MDDSPMQEMDNSKEEKTMVENEVAASNMEANCAMEQTNECKKTEPKKKRLFYRFCKRGFDICASIFGLVILSPLMLIIAIAIKLEDKGPAIFRTMRVGKDCKHFRFYKFRSMIISAPKDCAPRLLKDTDSLITKVGGFLRKTSLDEIPQLVCILKGDMSFIGPRPAGISEEDLIAEREKTGANSVVPGLTGLAQVSGRDVLAAQVKKKAKIDGEYVEKQGFWLDFKIFCLTIVKVFKRSDVVEGTNVVQKEEETQKAEKQEA